MWIMGVYAKSLPSHSNTWGLGKETLRNWQVDPYLGNKILHGKNPPLDAAVTAGVCRLVNVYDRGRSEQCKLQGSGEQIVWTFVSNKPQHLATAGSAGMGDRQGSILIIRERVFNARQAHCKRDSFSV